MQAMARDMVQGQQIVSGMNNNNQPLSQRQPITEEFVQMWINQLEQWTHIFYNESTTQNQLVWQEAQSKLVQFQKIHDPFELCMEIIKKSRNSLVLYQATLCLKNAVANDFKKFDLDELFKLFEFLYEFLCSQALDNDMSVNETAAWICAMILKRIASERIKTFSSVMDDLIDGVAHRPNPPTREKEVDRITHVISTLCNHIKEPNENLSKKIASALMLSSLLLECQMTNRSTFIGIRIWKHLNARRLIETHLKSITEVCLATINWAFTSNLLNPLNQTRETQILFNLVGSLIQCVEYSLSFNSTDTGCSLAGDRVLRVFQNRTIVMLSQASEQDQRLNTSSALKTLREWCDLVMSPDVVQFLFNLYTTVKSMINIDPRWNWPSKMLRNCLNILYFLSDVHNSTNIERGEVYANYVGNLMLGAVKILDSETKGIDDSFQIACLITSISMHTSETKNTISKIKADQFIPFIAAAQRFTCKVFTQVASTTEVLEEEEEERTVDALLDFWYHLFRSIESEIRYVETNHPTQTPKVTQEGIKAYSRSIVESYISCHLHKPLGQLVLKSDDLRDFDLEQAEEQDDNNVHAQQLISFGLIARFDPLHTAEILIELLGNRIVQFEAMLTQCINAKSTPDGIKQWDMINDDLHWLLLMLQHFLTQVGYGEIGFMCNEILNASVSYEANVQKTLQGFESCDYTSPEVDPIVRLVIVGLKLCQTEMAICQSGNINWLSIQTHITLTTFLSRFCLTYLYPKESDYPVISENMNYCFGSDAPTAEKFLRFVLEHTCCIILHFKNDPFIVNKNVQLIIQLLMYHPQVADLMIRAEEGTMIKMFISQIRLENLAGFSPKVARSLIKLSVRLFDNEEDWNKLIQFFTGKWTFIMTCIQSGQHQSDRVLNQFLEFCDFAIGLCESCFDDTTDRIFDQLLVPIVKALPTVLQAFGNFESAIISVFELLYYIVKLPMINISCWESQSAKSFYENCKGVIETYAQITVSKKNRGNEEEDCEDIISVLNFCHEVMKRDWGNSYASCDSVVKHAMEKISVIVKPEYLQFPRIRSVYYRLLVYLVDEDERLSTLSDILLNTIVSSILLALQSQFDKDVDNHTYTIIQIICRTIHLEKGTVVSERLAKFMMPVLPALFRSTISQGSFTINSETAEMIAPALFSLRCCFMNVYQSLVNDLIENQDDPYAQAKIKNLFEELETRIQKLTLNRTSIREFNTLFVPFLAKLHNFVTIK